MTEQADGRRLFFFIGRKIFKLWNQLKSEMPEGWIADEQIWPSK